MALDFPNLEEILDGAFYNSGITSIKNFFENVGVLPFKYTMKAYFDDLKTYGMIPEFLGRLPIPL